MWRHDDGCRRVGGYQVNWYMVVLPSWKWMTSCGSRVMLRVARGRKTWDRAEISAFILLAKGTCYYTFVAHWKDVRLRKLCSAHTNTARSLLINVNSTRQHRTVTTDQRKLLVKIGTPSRSQQCHHDVGVTSPVHHVWYKQKVCIKHRLAKRRRSTKQKIKLNHRWASYCVMRIIIYVHVLVYVTPLCSQRAVIFKWKTVCNISGFLLIRLAYNRP